MLPECRQSEYLYPVPKFNLESSDIDDFMSELKGFHDLFSDCFQRSESRGHFFQYMVGQFGELERKSIEPIALAVDGGKVRAMQRFVSDAPWDDTKIITKYRSFLVDDLAHPDRVLIFDESGFAKKGDDSIGVGKQYCGNLGKVENCQVGVFAGYTSPYGYALVDKQLYLPEKWFTDEYAERREKCKLPQETTFKTKPQLAAEMLKQISDESMAVRGHRQSDHVGQGQSGVMLRCEEENRFSKGKPYPETAEPEEIHALKPIPVERHQVRYPDVRFFVLK
jgi:SRSO17 transposase